jgi:hypothetical protein
MSGLSSVMLPASEAASSTSVTKSKAENLRFESPAAHIHWLAKGNRIVTPAIVCTGSIEIVAAGGLA